MITRGAGPQKRPLEDATNKAAKTRTITKAPTPVTTRAAVAKGPSKEQQLAEKVTELQDTLEGQTTANNTLRNELCRTMRDMNTQKQVIAEKDKVLSEKLAEFQVLSDEHAVVMSALRSEMEELKAKAADDIAAKESELEATKATHASLIAEKSAQIAEAEKLAETIRKERDEVADKLTQTQTDLRDARTLIGDLERHVSSLQENLRGVTNNVFSMKGQMSEREREVEELLVKGERERRRLLNVIEELRGNIRVYCRVRPHLDTTVPAAQIDFPDKLDHREIQVRQIRDNATSTGKSQNMHQFKFDRVFDADTTQQDIFAQVSPLVESVLDGYKVCVFAYGQTGSGKTHTMEGREGENMGIIPRSIMQLFNSANELANEHKWTFSISCTYIEIYNDSIRDLLADSEDYHRAVLDSNEVKHDIRHEGKTDTTVTNVKSVVVTQPYQVHDLLRTAAKNRSTARTKLNESSSRSHSVFTMKFEGMNTVLGQKTLGVLCLIDLAGSERVADSGAIGNASRMKEAVAINQSLAHLGDVISALGNQNEKGTGHIPFRNSKLTYLLQNYLGGEGSKTLMFVNVSPSEEHVNESVNSLRFASKVNSTVIGTAKRRIQAL